MFVVTREEVLYSIGKVQGVYHTKGEREIKGVCQMIGEREEGRRQEKKGGEEKTVTLYTRLLKPCHTVLLSITSSTDLPIPLQDPVPPRSTLPVSVRRLLG